MVNNALKRRARIEQHTTLIAWIQKDSQEERMIFLRVVALRPADGPHWNPLLEHYFLFLFFPSSLFFFIVHLQIVPISAVQQSNPFTHTIFHHTLSQEIGYSSLCYRVGSHCLSILIP